MTPPPSTSDLVGRAGDPTLDAIARLAAFIAGGSGAGVHILDEKVQYRIGALNAPLDEHPREDSLCRMVVDSDERIAASDASQEERFDYSSFTQGDPPPLRMYVGTPLRMSDGEVVGTLCSWDANAVQFSDEQLAAFDDLAAIAAALLESPR